MVRVQVTEDIVVVLTERRMRLWEAAEAARANTQSAWGNEDFDWQDWEDLWVEEDEAWAKFFD